MRKPQRHLQCRFFGFLLFFTCLTLEAYCIQVRGFNISQINAHQNDPHFRQPAEGSDNNRIDKMLEGYRFLTSSCLPWCPVCAAAKVVCRR
jgi:hypothetical protein